MILEVLATTEGFQWIDVVNPDPSELEGLAQRFGLPPAAVQACLDPEHLPKYEDLAPMHFMVLRAFDQESSHDADDVLDLTRKVSLFFNDNFLLTVHRVDQPFIVRVREKWAGKGRPRGTLPTILITDLAREALRSYLAPLERALDQLEKLEMGLFGAQGATGFQIEDAYYLKRKAATFKRILRMSLDLFGKNTPWPKGSSAQLTLLREEAQKAFFYAEELLDNSNTLLNLHLAMASQRTNEVMRVLTIFSVFILPLNVITGIYGMNFQHMPELESPYGYPLVLLSMGGLLMGIYVWFKRKGWMK